MMILGRLFSRARSLACHGTQARSSARVYSPSRSKCKTSRIVRTLCYDYSKELTKRFEEDERTLGDFIETALSPEQQMRENRRLRRRQKRQEMPKPAWLKASLPSTGRDSKFMQMKSTVKSLGLATVCESARCPNIGDCWGGADDSTATATIMLMGDHCTRACRFCAVKTSARPLPLDPQEPQKVADTIKKWNLDYVVLTSVDRDDIEDGGAAHIAKTVRRLKESSILVEVLTPDFSGSTEAIRRVVDSGLDVFAHNIETVERTRPKSQLSSVIASAEDSQINVIQSSIMLGCGESDDEVRQTLRDLQEHQVDIVTLGQYMQPTTRHMKIHEYVHPDKFNTWYTEAMNMGFMYCASGPLVRSSYRAGELFVKHKLRDVNN